MGCLMPTYRYRCPDCSSTLLVECAISERDMDLTCDQCPDAPFLDRTFSFAYKAPMAEHYNDSIGTYVNNERQFKDELKRVSDERSERLNLAHDFQPVDPDDTEALGVTEEGLHETHKRQVERGERETKLYVDL